jgi:hypothetical protein
MRKQLIVLLCGVAIAGYSALQAAPATPAEQTGSKIDSIVTLSPKAELRQELTRVEAERTEFVRNFNQTRNNSSSAHLAYNQRMKAFNRLVLELKLEYFQSQGDTKNAEMISTHLEKLDNPPKSPSLNLDRNTGEQIPAVKENAGGVK